MVVSYGRQLWNDDGTYYTQRILVTEREYDQLTNAVLSEISLNYPQRKKYSGYSTDAELHSYFPSLRIKTIIEGKTKHLVCFLTLTATSYLKKYPELKKRLKTDQNTYIEVIIKD